MILAFTVGGFSEWWGEFFQRGGYTMVPLILCSVLALAIIIERSLALRRSQVLPRLLTDHLERLRRPGELAALRDLCQRSMTPLAELIRTVLANRELPRSEHLEALSTAGRQAANRLERRLVILEVVAAAAPLLGLFGTVLGMVHVFADISSRGLGSADLARGIYEALYTTIVGLSIGIPSVVAYTLFSRRVENIVIEMEQHCARTVDVLYRQEVTGRREGQ